VSLFYRKTKNLGLALVAAVAGLFAIASTE